MCHRPLVLSWVDGKDKLRGQRSQRLPQISYLTLHRHCQHPGHGNNSSTLAEAVMGLREVPETDSYFESAQDGLQGASSFPPVTYKPYEGGIC